MRANALVEMWLPMKKNLFSCLKVCPVFCNILFFGVSNNDRFSSITSLILLHLSFYRSNLFSAVLSDTKFLRFPTHNCGLVLYTCIGIWIPFFSIMYYTSTNIRIYLYSTFPDQTQNRCSLHNYTLDFLSICVVIIQ